LDFERALLDCQVGQEVPLDVHRSGSVVQASLVLAEGTGLTSISSDDAWDQIGLRLSPVSATSFRKINTRYRGGLKVMAVRPGSPAEEHGIRRNDILVGMHKWETISLDNIAYILSSAEFKATQPFKFYILRGTDTLYGNMQAQLDR
jgi:serine protease Do